MCPSVSGLFCSASHSCDSSGSAYTAPSHCCVGFHCMDTPQFVLFCWGIFGLLLFLTIANHAGRNIFCLCISGRRPLHLALELLGHTVNESSVPDSHARTRVPDASHCRQPGVLSVLFRYFADFFPLSYQLFSYWSVEILHALDTSFLIACCRYHPSFNDVFWWTEATNFNIIQFIYLVLCG